jgi:hypothetical protein
MRASCLLLIVLTAASSLPRTASATEPTSEEDHPPPGGVGLLIGGGILTGIGALNLATSPLCNTTLVQSRVQSLCFDTSLVFGGALLAIGVPMLIVGANERSAYREWKKAHPVAAGLSIAPTPGGVALGWSTTF